MDLILDWTSEERRRKALIERSELSPGPEHLVSDDFFAYAQAQLTGLFDETLTRPELDRIESHLLDCDACLHAFAQIEQIVADEMKEQGVAAAKKRP